MNFSHPRALWLAALAVPVVLLHFYRGPRRRFSVPSLRFWDEALADEGRSSALRRIRHRASLALMLLAVAAMTAALSGPDLDAWRPAPRDVVILVDTGPELAAGGRLAEAQAGARDLLSRLGRRDRAALVDRSGVVEPLGSDLRRCAEALRGLPRDLPRLGREETLALAGRLAPGAELYVFSARPGPRVRPAGEPLDNTALGAPTLEGDRLRVPVVRRARARGPIVLVLRDRGQVVDRKSVELDARESAVVEWTIEAPRLEAGLRLECAVDPPDAYPADDLAALVTAPSLPPLVSVTGEAGPHLAGALDLLAKEGAIRIAETPAGAEVRIFDGVEPPPDAAGGILVLGAPVGAEVDAPKIGAWVREAPFHRDVDYAEVRLKRSRIVEGDALVESDRGPVAAWSSRLGAASLRFGFRFRIEDGDFALRPAFPILLRQAIAWLAGEGTRGFPAAAPAGGVLVNPHPLAVAEGSVAVTTLRGAAAETRSWPVHGGRTRIDVPVPGLVRVECGKDAEWIAVNDPDPGAVDLTDVARGPGPALPERIPAWKDPPVAAIAAALSILALLAEWGLARAA